MISSVSFRSTKKLFLKYSASCFATTPQQTPSLSSDIYSWPFANQGIAKSSTPPSSWYLQEEFLNKVEKEFTFRRWLNVSPASSLKNEGDYLAVTILDQPLLLVKGRNDVVSCFYNVCRHHAAQVCLQAVFSSYYSHFSLFVLFCYVFQMRRRGNRR
jgi:hypothetical protein